jgi:hypothetical protein
MRQRSIHAALAAVAVTVVSASTATLAPAQECPIAGSEGFHWKDPITGTCSAIGLSSKAQLRRKDTVRFTVVRSGIDSTDRTLLVNQNTGVTYNASGRIGGIGYITVDIDLGAAPLGDKHIRFPHTRVGGFLAIVQVVRKGEITGITQSPRLALCCLPVQVVVSGDDIGNASVELAGHSATITSNSDTQLQFTAKATTPTSATSVELKAWDRTLGRLVLRYVDPGVTTALTYGGQSAAAPCVSVPGIGAPQLSAPASGSVKVFPSGTDALKASVNFSWVQIGDPERKYLLHLEPSLASATTSGTMGTVGRTAGSTTSNPLGTTEVTVGPFSSSAVFASIARDLGRNLMYRWKVRAVNCGQPAPWSGVNTLTLR